MKTCGSCGIVAEKWVDLNMRRLQSLGWIPWGSRETPHWRLCLDEDTFADRSSVSTN